MQEMIDKYDPSKNSREDNKKNKRHAGVLAQAKQRDRQLAKMEEEGLIADPDAKSDEATIALRFPPPPGQVPEGDDLAKAGVTWLRAGVLAREIRNGVRVCPSHVVLATVAV